MVIFHLVVDLKEFYSFKVEYMSGFWFYEGKFSAILFILVAGISSTFSRNNLQRGIRIFGLGMLLTLVTYLYNPKYYIVFGILHFLGIGTILYHFTNRLRPGLFFAAALLSLFLGLLFAKINVETPYLFMIGLINDSFCSLDYYPLLPWLGIFFAGVLAGKMLYKNKKGLLPFNLRLTFVNELGRRSLLIYLIHQPVLLALLYGFHMVTRLK